MVDRHTFYVSTFINMLAGYALLKVWIKLMTLSNDISHVRYLRPKSLNQTGKYF